MGSEVVAIEPNPENARRIRAALARNRLDATLIEAAVGAREGSAYLDVQGESSTGRLAAEGIPVSVTTLDSVYEQREIAPPSFVKIDIEGSEGNVLLGAERMLAEARPKLLIELHPWVDAKDVFDHLAAYEWREVDDGHIFASPR